MTLPVALVDRWPMEEYKLQHSDICLALKHNVSDALKLYHELQELRTQFTSDTDKDSRRADKNLELLIREKEERYFRLTKFSDYPAMIMAAYPDSRFLDKSKYWEECENINGPVIIRGIANGKIGNHAVKNKKDYYFIETGYLGNYRSNNNRTGRKVYHRIVKNAMQHPDIMDVPDDRWKQLVKFNPNLQYHGWRKPGSKILLVLSTQKPFEYYGQDRERWIKNTIRTIKRHTDREIVIREKASRGTRTNETIYDALGDDIYALVTYNSIAAVEAVQYGIPAFALAPTAAAPVCSDNLKQIENPVKPDEDIVYKWLCSIAYGQFSLNEMLSGQAWQMVLENNERQILRY